MSQKSSNPTIRKPGDIIEGRYEVLRDIGRGGLSCSYHVRDIETSREWCLKEYFFNGDPNHDRAVPLNVKSEAEALERLHFRGIPGIRDAILKDDRNIIVMDLMPGITLQQKLKRESVIKPEEARRIIYWVCKRLEEIHAPNPPFIHRDIKPANIMVQDDGKATLIDFGTIRRYTKGLKRDEVLMNTEEYASPESMGRINRQTDPRSDIYSVGVVLNQIVTGRDPGITSIDPKTGKRKRIQVHRRYLKKEIHDAEKEKYTGEIRREGLLRIAEKCTREDPRDRFQSAKELQEALAHSYEFEKKYQKVLLFKKLSQVISIVMAAISLAAGAIVFFKGGYKMNMNVRILIIAALLFIIAGIVTALVIKSTKILKEKNSFRYRDVVKETDKYLEDDDLDETNLLVKDIGAGSKSRSVFDDIGTGSSEGNTTASGPFTVVHKEVTKATED